MGDRFKVNSDVGGGVLVGNIRDEVPESMVCTYFGPKSSKSGWKYQQKTTPEEQLAILNLYKRVYECEEIPNKEITLQFARGLILMSKGMKVDWDEFRVERRKYREGLRKKREVLQREKYQREGEGSGSPPSTVGRRRCQAPSLVDEIGFPTDLKLSVKIEGSEELAGLAMVKKGGGNGKGRGGVLCPRWEPRELEEMVSVIDDTSKLVTECRSSLAETSVEVVRLEDRLRRARMLKGDREAMVFDSEAELQIVNTAKMALLTKMSSRGVLLADLPVGDFNRAALEALDGSDKIELESLLFQRQCAERTLSLSVKVITDCDSTITNLEAELSICSKKSLELTQRVSFLDSLLVAMREQHHSMKEGGGEAFWPRPVSKSPVEPLHVTHTLNACPVCTLWYGDWDYVTAGCGHCYHPWCLSIHSKMSSKCLVNSCQESFSARQKIALGLRPRASSLCTPVKTEVRSTKINANVANCTLSGEINTTSEGVDCKVPRFDISSQSNQSPTKDMQPSQSSQTNMVLPNSIEASTIPPIQAKMCFGCKSKPPSVVLKECGHALFCFGCIQGKYDCPFCGEKITGWEQIENTIEGIPKLFPMDGSLNVKGNIAKSSCKKKTTETTLKEPLTSPQLDDTKALLYESDDDVGAGLQHWCSSEEFKNGGRRSMEFVLSKTSDIVEDGEEPMLDADIGLLKTNEASTSKKITVVADDEGDISKVFKRRTGPIDDSSEVLPNQTRKVQRAMSDLLAPSKKKPKTSSIQFIESSVSTVKRGRGRPISTSKATTTTVLLETVGLRGTNARLKTVPARLSDL